MNNPFLIFSKSKFSFDGQRHYENVQILLYRHWFTILAKLITFALFAFLPIIIYGFFSAIIAKYALQSLIDFLGYLYYMIWWFGLFRTLTMYVLDTWMVTDHRIIDSQQKGFFRRNVAEMNLGKIQDISVNLKGIIPTFLDYGNLEVQTAGVEQKFMFHQIAHPQQVKDLIMQSHNEYIAQHRDGREIHESQ